MEEMDFPSIFSRKIDFLKYESVALKTNKHPSTMTTMTTMTVNQGLMFDLELDETAFFGSIHKLH